MADKRNIVRGPGDRGMRFARLPSDLLDSRLGLHANAVFGALAYHDKRSDGIVFPRLATIAEVADLSINSVRKAQGRSVRWTTSRIYDFRNNLIDETDQAGHVTHHVYDLAGRLTLLTKAYGTSAASATTYTYYDDGKKQSESDALGHVTTYTYDAAGRLIALAGVQGNTTYAYDDAGNRISSTDANGNVTQYQYDARKRLVATIYPDATSTTNSYDGPGNLVGVTDQAGNRVQYTFDAANQLQSVVQLAHPQPSHNTNTNSYDNLGNLTSLTDENGHTTQNAFDLLSDLTSKTLPDGSLTETRSYDPAGNLLSLQHFNGKTTTYSYDPLNRLLTRTADSSYGEPVVSYTYTPTGKRATMTDASGTTTYSYDSLYRLTTKATPEGTLNYTYDAAGDVASMASSDANGVSVSYTYDSLNRLSTVVDNRLVSGQNTTTYTYDPANNLVTAKLPNQLQSTFNYDKLNRMTSLTSSGTSPASGYLYQLGPTGMRTNATELTGRTLNWSYDGIYRLTNEAISNDPAGVDGSVGYGLDPVGNRLSAASTLTGISSGTFSFTPDDLLTAETYDANGNVLTTGGKVFTYDSENRLKSMNGGAVSLVYDGDGNRVAKTASGVTTRYLIDDLNPTGYAQVVEELVGTTVQREYTYGLQRIDENQLISNTWTQSFYGYDGGGSVRQLTNSSGVVTDKYDYDAFGNLINSTGTTPNSYRYRGEQYDSDLGLYYLRARYYNPSTGRFMSRDPYDGNKILPPSLHKYLYASGNPVNRVDPRGRADLFEYAIESNAAVPEAKLLSIYGCIGDAGLAAADLILEKEISASTALGGASTVIGCVLLTPGIGELAEEGSKIAKTSVKAIEFIGNASSFGACALDAEDFINGLDSLISGSPDGKDIGKSIESLVGCVGDRLAYLLTHPGAAPQGLGLP